MDGTPPFVYISATKAMTNQPIVSTRVHFAAYRTRLDWNFPSLAAPYWRFYWNRRGHGEIRLPNRTHILAPGVGYIIPPDTVFSSRTTTPIDHFYVHFSIGHEYGSLVPGLYEAGNPKILKPIIDEIIGQLPPSGEPEPRRDRRPLPPDTPVSLLASALVLAALSSIPVDTTSAFLDADTALVRAVNFIDAHLGEHLSLEQIATVAGCSERSLRRRFRTVFGKTPTSFVTLRRVERACILLHFSEYTIDEIADSCGFCDRYHLSNTFRRVRGIGPARFRRTRLETELGA